jgi:hypothetical protein
MAIFEHHHQPMAPRLVFWRRVAFSAMLALAIMLGSLLLGVVGFHVWGKLEWIDALQNASMLLGGMGPVERMDTVPGKLFASFYALYAGIVFLILAGVLLAPVLHRFLHHFHLEMVVDANEPPDVTPEGPRQR